MFGNISNIDSTVKINYEKLLLVVSRCQNLFWWKRNRSKHTITVGADKLYECAGVFSENGHAWI